MFRVIHACLAVAALLALARPAAGAPAAAEFEAQARIVAVGDIHGDLAQFVQVLRDAGLVDEKLRWAGGRTHLVQLGDVPDRGPDTLEVIRLLQRLEKESRADGGAVHCLIGNHEAMNMTRDLRYVHPGEFAAFATPKSTRIQESQYTRFVATLKSTLPKEDWPAFDDVHRQTWFAQNPPGSFEHAEAWSPKGEIGRWVLDHNAVLRIGDTLFVHGGLGPRYAGSTIEQINTAVRSALKNPGAAEGTVVRDQEGPLWYRGLAQHPEAREQLHLETLLAHFKVRRIVVGHTPMPGAVVPRFGARVILTDVGLNQVYGGGRACLIIEDSIPYAVHHGTRLELPTGGLASVVGYLREVAALDPGSKPVLKLIRTVEASLSEESKAASDAPVQPEEAVAP